MTGLLPKDQIFIRKLTEITQANMGNENFDSKELANKFGISLYNLSRRLYEITNKTVNQFIRETRLLKALEMLQNEEVTASEVAYKVGFGSPSYFSTCFHEFFGYPPAKAKKGNFDDTEKINSIQGTAKKEQKGPAWRILILISSGVLFLVVLSFLISHLFIKNSSADAGNLVKIPEKSVAILPFKNLSDSTINQYFIDGVMEDILTNLSRVHDLRVISRTSTEQFRETKMSASQIGKKLNVNYIVEGSGQKYGNAFRLRVQLIETSTDKHIWAESYEGELRETKDIFKIQSQVAQAIAAELKATITPEEKQLIETVHTTNLTAYYFYLKGKDEINKYWSDFKNKQALKRAEGMFNNALENDSTFARAYVGLADVYMSRHVYESYYSETYLDSVLILADRALSYDDNLAEAYYARADYYIQNGEIEQALKEYDKALEYNPNYWEAYSTAGWKVYFLDYNHMDFVKGLEYLQKAVSINHGKEMPDLLRRLGEAYANFAGVPEKAKNCYQEAFKLDGDTITYLGRLASMESASGNYARGVNLYKRCYAIDSNKIEITSQLASNYELLGKYAEALKYVKKIEARLEDLPQLFYSANRWIGYVYWQEGYHEEAERRFNIQKKLSEESIKAGRFYSIDANYDLAALYNFMGDREKAYENLRIVAKIHACPLWLINLIKNDPFFNSMRNEPEFQKIVKKLDSKYLSEHERVMKWLEERQTKSNLSLF
jgi:TolB-like protein/AraC-like DNA-binding protein/Tfp pilus assembly protein PilF